MTAHNPEAKVIHMFRDPRASFASALSRGWLGPRRVGLPDVPALRIAIGGLTAIDHVRRWALASDLDQEYGQRFPDRYLLCRFEKLLCDPEGTTRGISDFLGLEFKPEMLQPGVGGASSFVTSSGEAFDKAAAGRWREHLDPPLSRWVSWLARSRLVAHGYPRR